MQVSRDQGCYYYLCFYVNDEPESKFLCIETIKLYCIVFVDVVTCIFFLNPQPQQLLPGMCVCVCVCCV